MFIFVTRLIFLLNIFVKYSFYFFISSCFLYFPLLFSSSTSSLPSSITWFSVSALYYYLKSFLFLIIPFSLIFFFTPVLISSCPFLFYPMILSILSSWLSCFLLHVLPIYLHLFLLVQIFYDYFWAKQIYIASFYFLIISLVIFMQHEGNIKWTLKGISGRSLKFRNCSFAISVLFLVFLCYFYVVRL